MSRRRIRNPYRPSSSHKLALMVEPIIRRYPDSNVPAQIERELMMRHEEVARIVGPERIAWAIEQLSAPPHIKKGWPKSPIKRRRMPKGGPRK